MTRAAMVARLAREVGCCAHDALRYLEDCGWRYDDALFLARSKQLVK